MALRRQPSANGDDTDRLDVEFSRLLCDDGRSESYKGGAGTTQGSRGVDGLTATGLDAASRMRQGDGGGGRYMSWINTANSWKG